MPEMNPSWSGTLGGHTKKDTLKIVGSTPPPVLQCAHGSETDPRQFEFGAKQPQPQPARPVARGVWLHHDGHGGAAGGQGQGGEAAGAETVS